MNDAEQQLRREVAPFRYGLDRRPDPPATWYAGDRSKAECYKCRWGSLPNALTPGAPIHVAAGEW